MSEFDEAIRVGPDGRCTVHDGWDLNGNANGGYLMAMLVNHVLALAGRPDPVSVTAHYLAPGRSGPAQASGAVLKAGKRFSTVTGTLSQNDAPVLQLLATLGEVGRPDPDDEMVNIVGAPPELPPFDSLPRRTEELRPDWLGARLIDRLDLRLHPDDAGFLSGRKTGQPLMRGWLAFADGRPMDSLGLLLACDVFPPSSFNLPQVGNGWIPTVQLTVHVRAQPCPGPVAVQLCSNFLHSGMFAEDGEIWDSEGTLVAQSRQLALISRPDPDRWAGRARA